MKIKAFFSFLMMTMVSMIAVAQTSISIDLSNLKAGETCNVPVVLHNEDALTAIQADVYVSENLTLNKVSRGKVTKTMNEDEEYVFDFKTKAREDNINVIIASNPFAVLDEGEIFVINVTAAEDITDATITLKNIVGSDEKATAFEYEDVSAVVEPLQMITTTSLMFGEDEVAINDHSAVSVESANAIKVQVENAPEAIGFTYAIKAMNLNEDEEGQFWTVGQEIVVGEGNFNGGMGYATFKDEAENDTIINFEEGNKYQVEVTVMGGNPAEPVELGSYTYEINGSYVAPMITTTSLMFGEDETAINDHSAVSVETANAIKVQVENAPEAIGFTYAIKAMNLNEDEEGQFWTVGQEIVVGEGNFNGGMGYATFKDEAENDTIINFEEGNKYQVLVSVVDRELNEIAVKTYEINGSYVAPMTVSTSLMLGEDETAINDHSAVSVESANAIKVQVENAPEAIGFTYAIKAMNLNENEEGQFWTVGQEIVVGEGNFNGGMGYATFKDEAENDTIINFEEGNKYQVLVSVVDRELNEIAVKTYEINGSYVAPMTVSTSLMLGEDETAINDHSAVSVETANAIKVQVENAPQAIGFTYAIKAMNLNADEEGQFWTVGQEIVVGEGNFNGGMGYATFKDEAENDTIINFEAGNKYQVEVTVVGGNPAEPVELGSYTYEINGSYVEPVIAEVALLNGEDIITLNTHDGISVEKMDGIKVLFGQPGVKSALYSIIPMYQEDGQWLPSYPQAKVGYLTINNIGYAEVDYTFFQGNKYMIKITAEMADGGEESVEYMIDGATEKEPKENILGEPKVSISADNSTLLIEFKAPENIENPSLATAGVKFKVNGVEYYGNADEAFVEDGKLVMSIPFASTMEMVEYSSYSPVNGDVLNITIMEPEVYANLADGSWEKAWAGDDITCTYTVTVSTGINAVVADKAGNGVMYNLSGQKVNAAKGIVIKNGKKFIVK